MKKIIFYIFIFGLFTGCDMFKNSDLGTFLDQSKGEVKINSISITPDYYQVRVFTKFVVTANVEAVKSDVVSVEADLTPIGLGIVSLEKNGGIWSNAVWAETPGPGTYSIVFSAVNDFGRVAVLTNTVRAYQYEAVYVAAWGDDTNSGLTNISPVRTIQKAAEIFQNAGVGEIRVSEGVYDDYTSGYCVQMAPGMKIKGGYESYFTANNPALYPTEIAGKSNVYHVIVAAGGGTCTLDGLIISGGYAMDDFLFNKHGGAILALNTSLIIKNCTIKSNAALQCGGAVYAMNGSILVSNCIVSGNFSYSKGGSFCFFDTPSVIIRDTMISNTSSGDGGAIWGKNTAQFVLQDSIIAKTKSHKSGGGIYLQLGSFTLENSIIHSGAMMEDTDSAVLSGGAAYFAAGTLKIHNCIFSNNTVSNMVAFCSIDGNGLYLTGITNGSITFSKFVKNYAYSVYGIHAGAVFLDGYSSGSIVSNIFSMNSNSTTLLSGAGGIHLYQSSSPVVIDYNTFQANYPAAIADGYYSIPTSVKQNGFNSTMIYFHIYGAGDINNISDLNNLDSVNTNYYVNSIAGNYDF